MVDKNEGKFLKVISTPSQIRLHPLNNSISKQFCVFPKQERFKKQKSLSTDILFYEIDRDFFKQGRKTNFGYGEKQIFKGIGQNCPGPERYQINQHTISQNSLKKGYVFGESREKCVVMGEKNIKDLKQLPGPGSYQIGSIFNQKHKRGYSFRIKTKEISTDKNLDTGPGKYDYQYQNKQNKFILSNMKNQRNIKINPLSTNKARIEKENSNNFNYDISFQMNPKGKYFNSKFKNVNFGKFTKSKRILIKGQNQEVPGPGSYQLNSDFGLYQSSQC